jgi:hypothetical protein
MVTESQQVRPQETHQRQFSECLDKRELLGFGDTQIVEQKLDDDVEGGKKRKRRRS